MDRPSTRFVGIGAVSIAYQIMGNGPRTVLGIPGFAQNIDLLWDEPHARRFLERFASFSTLVHFDKRGTGLSDREIPLPTLEQRAEEALAVMDAAGVERAVLAGFSEGSTLAAFLAATHPERTEALMLAGGMASYVRRDDHPWAPTLEGARKQFELVASVWGQGVVTADFYAPSMSSDQAFREWAARYELQSIHPARIHEFSKYVTALDVREVLASIHVPTLVFHAAGDRIVPIESGRYLADHIEGAAFVEVPGEDHALWFGNQDAWLDAMANFLTGEPRAPEARRVLSTVLLADIVGSTTRAAGEGDSAWTAMLDRHDRLAQDITTHHRGRIVKSTGDGVLATFDSPSCAVRAASDFVGRMRADLGLSVRVGLHCGEIELRGDDIAGIAVHVAARIEALAPAEGVTVSSTVKDLVAGSGFSFSSRGRKRLKGIEEPIALFDLVDS